MYIHLFNLINNNGINKFKKIVFVFIGFLVLIFLADILLGKMSRFLLKKQHSGWEYSTKFSIETTTAPIIILGNSRGIHDYEPDIITNKVGLDCYNASRDDQSILYHCAIFNTITKRYTPKIVILDISYNMLGKYDNNYSQLNYLLPYYATHPEIKSIIETKGSSVKTKFLSAFYPYHSMFFTIAKGYFKKDKTLDSLHGFKPIAGYLSGPLVHKSTDLVYPLDTVLVHYLQKMIDTCQQLGIQLYLSIAPYYYHTVTNDISVNTLESIAKQKNIPLLNFSNYPTFLQHPVLFRNYENLNKKGADIYTNLLMDTILKLQKR